MQMRDASLLGLAIGLLAVAPLLGTGCGDGNGGGGGTTTTTTTTAPLTSSTSSTTPTSSTTTTTLAATFVGKDVCAGCHTSGPGPAVVAEYEESGHAFKLNPVNPLPRVDQPPAYPFSTAPDLSTGFASGTNNTLGPPTSWEDVSYVIGGYGWKARFMDRDGFIVTGPEVQWNLVQPGLDQARYSAMGTWTAYDADEHDKPYNCGRCHTTGFSAEGHQNGLPGIEGIWAFPGIQCEACHGPGSIHASTMNPSDITVNRDSSLCGNCHTRDSQNRIAAKGGFGRHHEQYDEWLALDVLGDLSPTGPHSSGDTIVGCNDCHDPHASTKYDAQAEGNGVKAECADCHNATNPAPGLEAKDYAITTGGMQGLDCVDCHMPRISKSAVAGTAEGSGPATGDIRTHLFRIDLSLADAEQFVSVDGSDFVNTSVTGLYACKTCHNGVTAFNLDFPSGIKIHE